MGDHSRAKRFRAQIGQNPEHSSVQGDQNHHPEALVTREARADVGGRKENAPAERFLVRGHELPLQVTSKDCLPSPNTGGNGERYPKCQVSIPRWGSMDTIAN